MNVVVTVTRTQSPDWQVPLTAAPAMSTQAYEETESPGTRPRWAATAAWVSGLAPRAPSPGWTLVARAISRAAFDDPLYRNTARPRSIVPMSSIRKTEMPKANSTSP